MSEVVTAVNLVTSSGSSTRSTISVNGIVSKIAKVGAAFGNIGLKAAAGLVLIFDVSSTGYVV